MPPQRLCLLRENPAQPEPPLRALLPELLQRSKPAASQQKAEQRDPVLCTVTNNPAHREPAQEHPEPVTEADAQLLAFLRWPEFLTRLLSAFPSQVLPAVTRPRAAGQAGNSCSSRPSPRPFLRPFLRPPLPSGTPCAAPELLRLLLTQPSTHSALPLRRKLWNLPGICCAAGTRCWESHRTAHGGGKTPFVCTASKVIMESDAQTSSSPQLRPSPHQE